MNIKEVLDTGRSPENETFAPNHFYAAYIFDQPETHKEDISFLIEEAKRLGYPVRHWWLSQAMDIQGSPDRLIVCVHHPNNDESAGMDLYNILHEKQIFYDELNAAALEEYLYLGKRVAEPGDIHRSGVPLFESE